MKYPKNMKLAIRQNPIEHFLGLCSGSKKGQKGNKKMEIRDKNMTKIAKRLKKATKSRRRKKDKKWENTAKR